MKRVLPGLYCFLLLLAFGRVADAITFSDGLTHVIDSSSSFPTEAVIIDDGPGGAVTTVQIVDGGAAASIEIRGSSIAEIMGGVVTGTVGSKNSATDSVLRISGGQIGAVGDWLDNNGSILMSGGTVTGTFHVSEQLVEITAGSVNHIHLNPGADSLRVGVAISGGVFGSLDTFNLSGKLLDVSGGEFLGLFVTAGGAHPTIRGGVFRDRVQLLQGGATISGGTFLGDEITVLTYNGLTIAGGDIRSALNLGVGVTSILGSGFNYPLGEVSDLSGTLTGTMADGTPISTTFIQGTNHILVLAPEPSAALLVATGLAALALARRRRLH